MTDLRALAESHLAITIEGDWSKEVTLVGPDDGEEQILRGQVLYDRKIENPDTGQEMIVNAPVVSLRISSMDPVPKKDEKWFIKMPISPVAGAPIENFLLDGGRAREGGPSLGYFRYYPRKAEQS